MHKTIRNLSQLEVRPQGRHSLPFPRMLPSRLCTSIIFSFKGLSKDVIKLNLVLCHDSWDFIITQEGLKGILKRVHDNFCSFLLELRLSEDFARRFGNYDDEEPIGKLIKELGTLSRKKQALLLRERHPAKFIESLKVLGRNDTLDLIYGVDNESNYTWRILGTLVP